METHYLKDADATEKAIACMLETGNRNPLLQLYTPWMISFLQLRFQANEDQVAEILCTITHRLDRIVKTWQANASIEFPYYFASVLRNCWYDVLRKKMSVPAESADSMFPVTIAEMPSEPESDIPQTLRKYLSWLSPKQYVVICLYFGFPMHFLLMKNILNIIRNDLGQTPAQSRKALRNFLLMLQKKSLEFSDRKNLLFEKSEHIYFRKQGENLASHHEYASLYRRIRKLDYVVSCRDIGKLLHLTATQVCRIKGQAIEQLSRVIPRRMWADVQEQNNHYTQRMEVYR